MDLQIESHAESVLEPRTHGGDDDGRPPFWALGRPSSDVCRLELNIVLMFALALVVAAHIPRPAAVRPGELSATVPRSLDDWARTYTSSDPTAGALDVAAQWERGFRGLAARLAGGEQPLWQREPIITDELSDTASGFFTLDHLRAAVDSNFLDAGRGVYDERGPAGWQMDRVGTPRGTSFEDAKLTFDEVEAALRKGTVVFNSFGAHHPALSQLCLGALGGFGLPVNINLYCTRAGQKLSAPPHTDKQDVLVVQTQGAKRWRVFAPPEPSKRPAVDPYERGKASDRLELAELGEPLIETTLAVGQTLYVPAGYPHTTSTVGVDTAEPSVHLTINVDTHIWALSYEYARRLALAHAGAEDGLALTGLPLRSFLELQDTLPFGVVGGGGAPDEARRRLADGLARRMCAVQPERWGGAARPEGVDLDACAARLAEHYEALLDVQRRMYMDGALELTPTPRGVSFFRVKPYMDELEATMESLLGWAGLGAPGAKPAAAPAAKAKGKAGKKKGAKAAKGKGGFG